MPKAYHINSQNQTVTAVEYSTLEEMRRFVGGHICVASMDYSTGDVLYVDDEGLLKEPEYFFWYKSRPDQPLAGNGLYVGREVEDETTQGWTTIDPVLTLQELRKRIAFFRA